MSEGVNRGGASKFTIVAFGDSITEGTYGGAGTSETYPAILEKMLLEKQVNVGVINMGIPGETAPEALFRLQRDVIDLNPDIVVVMYGANDAYIPPDYNFPAVSTRDFSKAIGKMVNRLAELSIKTILMTTTPFAELDSYGHAEKQYLELNRESLESHLEEVRKIANEKQILLIDHYKTWQQLDKSKSIIKEYLPDGVHPNARGNYLLAKTIYQVLINDAEQMSINDGEAN